MITEPERSPDASAPIEWVSDDQSHSFHVEAQRPSTMRWQPVELLEQWYGNPTISRVRFRDKTEALVDAVRAVRDEP